jgi:hypothetical protein
MKSIDEMSLSEIKAAAEAAELAAQEPVEQTVYRRTVGGKEFTASSETELGDLVAQAAEELIAANKPAPVVKAERTADEEFVLAQEMASNPSKAFSKLLLETTGLTPEAFKQQVQATQAQENNAAAELFVEQHPDYLANSHNGAVLQSAMKKKGFEGRITVADIKAAYTECRDAGLLEERPAPVDPYALPLATLKNLANNTNIQEPEAGDGWNF